MTNVLRLTEHPPLRRDQAFERLRDAIITGHFAPGARLIERELCEAMGGCITVSNQAEGGATSLHSVIAGTCGASSLLASAPMFASFACWCGTYWKCTSAPLPSAVTSSHGCADTRPYLASS